MAERNANNPLTISDAAIDATSRLLTDNPGQDLKGFQDRMRHTRFADILHHEFEVFRMRSLGWNIEVSQADKAKYGVTVDSIEPMGSEGENYDDGDHQSWDYITGTELIRAFIANSFVEQATLEGKPTPTINSEIIDSPPFMRQDLPNLSATKRGAKVMVVEDLDAQMQQENGRLYQEVMGLKDRLVDRFTPRTLQFYGAQPEAYMVQTTPQIREGWERSLRETALRTYAWFTPNEPKLVPVPVKPIDKK